MSSVVNPAVKRQLLIARLDTKEIFVPSWAVCRVTRPRLSGWSSCVNLIDKKAPSSQGRVIDVLTAMEAKHEYAPPLLPLVNFCVVRGVWYRFRLASGRIISVISIKQPMLDIKDRSFIEDEKVFGDFSQQRWIGESC